jgi:hypothetical protein
MFGKSAGVKMILNIDSEIGRLRMEAKLVLNFSEIDGLRYSVRMDVKISTNLE